MIKKIITFTRPNTSVMWIRDHATSTGQDIAVVDLLDRYQEFWASNVELGNGESFSFSQTDDNTWTIEFVMDEVKLVELESVFRNDPDLFFLETKSDEYYDSVGVVRTEFMEPV